MKPNPTGDTTNVSKIIYLESMQGNHKYFTQKKNKVNPETLKLEFTFFLQSNVFSSCTKFSWHKGDKNG